MGRLETQAPRGRYTLIAAEACAAAAEFRSSRACPFTHVVVQAGVGGLAAAMAGWFADRFGSNAPILIVVEPAEAACLLASARAGAPTQIGGTLETVMAMLSCGYPSAPAWDILQRHADAFVAIADANAEEAVRRFARPGGDDIALAVGESGAAGLGALLALSGCTKLKDDLRLDAIASILLIATEAPTDLAAWNRSCGNLSFSQPDRGR